MRPSPQARVRTHLPVQVPQRRGAERARGDRRERQRGLLRQPGDHERVRHASHPLDPDELPFNRHARRGAGQHEDVHRGFRRRPQGPRHQQQRDHPQGPQLLRQARTNHGGAQGPGAIRRRLSLHRVHASQRQIVRAGRPEARANRSRRVHRARLARQGVSRDPNSHRKVRQLGDSVQPHGSHQVAQTGARGETS